MDNAQASIIMQNEVRKIIKSLETKNFKGIIWGDINTFAHGEGQNIHLK